MKRLRFKKLSPSEEDKITLRLLRQRIYIAEQMRNTKAIKDNEYYEELKKIVKVVKMLEAKYEIS